MSAFVHDATFRALEIVDRVPAGCLGVLVTRTDFDPHLRRGEMAIVDTTDREPQHGELYAIEMANSRVTSSLTIVQVFRRDGGLWCRFAFKAPGAPPALADGPFTPAGWDGKCVGRIVGAIRPVWQGGA